LNTWRSSAALTALAAAALAAACTSRHSSSVAELVILDGDVQTMDSAQPQARALAVKGGKIVYVGGNAGAHEWIGHTTRVLRVAGATVLPGLIDTHIHVMEGALDQGKCSFGDKPLDVAQIRPIILECAARSPGNGWVVVMQLNAAGFIADNHDLDTILKDRPLLLWAADGHDAWVNSEALKRAGISRKSVDPPRGTIVRDRHGEPNGLLVDAALDLASRLIDKPGNAERERALLSTLDDLAKAGITSYMEANASEETVRSYVQLAHKQQLHAHVVMALRSDGIDSEAEFTRLKALRALAATEPLLRADFIKLFADGIMEFPTQSAAMLEPYLEANGRPGRNLGPTYLSTEVLTQFIRHADGEGFNVHIHAIGDRAARIALDAYADARAHGSQRSYSIAHLELVDPQDLPRFKTLNVYASLQLQWASPDNYSVEAVLPYIGAARQQRLYPERSLKNAGATIVGGSDWNVSTFNPFEAMAIAISRRNPAEPQRGELGVNETLPLHDLFGAYTIEAARMVGLDARLGSLQAGKAADLIVLDRHLDDTSASSEVLATKVRYTFMNGDLLVGASAR
jgi:predicted amidohydrolase YtcJ